MSGKSFSRYADKLDQNVYGSLKGKIRLQLLQKDIEEFCPCFSSRKITVLDIGGGSGQFARVCLERGHDVLLCDSSEEMLARAQEALSAYVQSGSLRLLHHDFDSETFPGAGTYDLVVMHGSAEWMGDTAAAVKKACRLAASNGYLSLLIFNRDKYVFKLGINGSLPGGSGTKKKKLIPPGAMSVGEVRHLLHQNSAQIILQSGIRIFYNFFRQIDRSAISDEAWLAQELRHYRQVPFSLMGEHSHFVCRFAGAAKS